MSAEKDAKQQPQAQQAPEQLSALEGDDTFEEFAGQVHVDAAPKEEEGKDLWVADWDDEDTTDDFQAKLRQELDRHMKD